MVRFPFWNSEKYGIQSINSSSPDNSSFLSVTKWSASKAGWRSLTWHEILLTRTNCWLTTPDTHPHLNLVIHWLPGGFIQTGFPQHMAHKPPPHQVTPQCQFPLLEPSMCSYQVNASLWCSIVPVCCLCNGAPVPWGSLFDATVTSFCDTVTWWHILTLQP